MSEGVLVETRVNRTEVRHPPGEVVETRTEEQVVERVDLGELAEVMDRTAVEEAEHGIRGPLGLPGDSATEYVVDTPSAAGEQGPLTITIVNEDLSELVSAEGDHGPLATSKKGELFIRAQVLADVLTTLARMVGPYITPLVSTRDVTGVFTLMTPASGQRLQVRRIWVKGEHNIADTVEFEIKLGATVIAHDECLADQPYADGVVKLGDPDAILTLELLSAKKVFYNISVTEVA